MENIDENYLDSSQAARLAREKGKARYHQWLMANWLGQDPDEYRRKSEKKVDEKWLAYTDYVRDNKSSPSDQAKSLQVGGNDVKQKDLTLENIEAVVNKLLVKEREFIGDSFDTAIAKIESRFDQLEDHLDRHDIDIATLKTDVRHIKQALRTRETFVPSA